MKALKEEKDKDGATVESIDEVYKKASESLSKYGERLYKAAQESAPKEGEAKAEEAQPAGDTKGAEEGEVVDEKK